jgi:hypothetical protein
VLLFVAQPLPQQLTHAAAAVAAVAERGGSEALGEVVALAEVRVEATPVRAAGGLGRALAAVVGPRGCLRGCLLGIGSL